MKLTKTQQKIVKTIKDLYRQNEPLNITAVKRRHPELMKAVYAVKPYWGWKKALEAAGIKYSDIKVELLDYCECEICHAQPRALPWHIRRKHHADTDDYLIDYPGAELVSEETRVLMSKMRCQDPPHWEKLWTPEYVLDRLWHQYEKGEPINLDAIFHHDLALYAQAELRFGSFDNALRKLGLNPAEIRRKVDFLRTKEEVLEAIVQRRRRHLPLYGPRVITGDKDSDGVLYCGGVRLFGSWKKAIAAAGLKYETLEGHPPINKYSTPESVIRGTKKRNQKGRPLDYTYVMQGKYCDRDLFWRALKFFGTWKNAISTAGIEYAKVARKQAKYTTKKSVIMEIQRRHKEGLLKRTSDIIKGPNRDPALYTAAWRCFGGWRGAIKHAGLLKLLKRRRKYPVPKDVLKEIRRRRRENIPIDSKSVRVGSHRNYALYNRALKFFGGWGKAVGAAGIKYILINRHQSKYPGPEDVLREIRKRRKAGLPLNSKAMFVDCKYRDRTLLRRGQIHFGSWPKAIQAAGIRYEDVAPSRRRYPTKESVIAGIRRRKREGLPMSARGVHIGYFADCALYESALLFFKHWNTAVEKAGFSYPEEARYWRGIYPTSRSALVEIRRRQTGLTLQR